MFFKYLKWLAEKRAASKAKSVSPKKGYVKLGIPLNVENVPTQETDHIPYHGLWATKKGGVTQRERLLLLKT